MVSVGFLDLWSVRKYFGVGNSTPLQYSCLGNHMDGSLVGFSPWGRKESAKTEWLHFHFSLSCTGKGNGNPLQCSCLENPRDRGAWWAAIYGVTQSRTRLMRLSKQQQGSIFLFSTMKWFCIPFQKEDSQSGVIWDPTKPESVSTSGRPAVLAHSYISETPSEPGCSHPAHLCRQCPS